MNQNEERSRGDEKKIISVYIFTCTMLASQFIPFIPIQIAGALLFPLSFAAIGLLRMGREKDSLIYNHMTYLWRTLWIWSLWLAIAIPLAGYWAYAGSDHSLFLQWFDNAKSGVAYSRADLETLLNEFMRTNLTVLISAAVVCVGPTILYIVYRLAKGMSRAFKGYRIANPQAWF